MKTTNKNILSVAGIVLVLLGCSTKKDSFTSRNIHALSSKYNILYNGNVALDKGIVGLKDEYNDNFWQVLPVERMQVDQDNFVGEQKKNQNFDRAEEKAVKAIQKHSMNISGRERNPQMDEAHLLLGVSRYYEQRFVPALEAFNYVLYKYPSSSQINIVKIWREKTNMRLDNDAQAVENLRKLLKDIKYKDQVFADANATIAQAFINLKEKDSAIDKLKLAAENTKISEEKARYLFITAQLHEELNQIDSAKIKYQWVIDMNRKAPRQYVIRAQSNIDKYFDPTKQDTLLFVKRYKKMLEDRENRPYLDMINHQLAFFYDKQKNTNQAKKYYNKSLKSNSLDKYLIASNYRNLGEMDFDNALYASAGKYYDSTLAFLNPRTREFRQFTKKRDNLADVIKYEKIAFDNDSILRAVAMSSDEKEKYFGLLVEKLKAKDEKQKMLDAQKNQNIDANNNINNIKDVVGINNIASKADAIKNANLATTTASAFYFYNAATVQQGKIEFKKKWGDRALTEYWRVSKEAQKLNSKNNLPSNNTNPDVAQDNKLDEKNMRYDSQFYIQQLPTKQEDLDLLTKDMNFANFQLGVIYKEKFKEYQRAATKLEKVLSNNPEERLVLPSMYNLYKIYQTINPAQAEVVKAKILLQYPDSRYAQILNNKEADALTGTPDENYTKLYKDFEKGNYREVLLKTDEAITQYTGEDILPKFELLKASLLGKLYGLVDYKKALNFVALTYPNSDEGKQAEAFLVNRFKQLEELAFNSELPLSWKVLYKADLDNAKNKNLLEKITQFIKDRKLEKTTISNDIYTIDKNFIIIHGIKTQNEAQEIIQILKNYKDYKLADLATIISNENYKVVQVKKNFDDYIAGNWINKEIIPVNKNIFIPKEIIKQEPKIEFKKAEPKSGGVPNPNNINDEDPMPKKGVKNNAGIDDTPLKSTMPPSSKN